MQVRDQSGLQRALAKVGVVFQGPPVANAPRQPDAFEAYELNVARVPLHMDEVALLFERQRKKVLSGCESNAHEGVWKGLNAWLLVGSDDDEILSICPAVSDDEDRQMLWVGFEALGIGVGV
ncbi:hypothetical protein [Pseudorhodoferax aquiterrae]|uniref:hypothetical protein n=1 Tax=Pseudorhodoferax aquiterrae TaxID=747304 RepID=UPI0016728AC7|nr:hypothetical protein [Pseudorhodoferax aquiterrae]